jgi:hypothetical protein
MTTEIQERLDRALSQRLYLLDAKKIAHNDWNFTVEGSTGTSYNLKFNETGMTCACIDFKKRKQCCKHIYFMFVRVLKCSDPIVICGDPKRNPFELKEGLSDEFELKLFKRLEKTPPGSLEKAPSEVLEKALEKTLEKIIPEDPCSRCFEDYSDGSAHIKCLTCKQYFHDACMKVWLKNKNSCPLCRSKMEPSPIVKKVIRKKVINEPVGDALEKFLK